MGFIIFCAIIYFIFIRPNVNNNSKGHYTSNNHNANKIQVNCPYCNSLLNISEPGNWECSSCKNVFVYRDNIAFKYDDICSENVINITALLSKIAKADGIVSQIEVNKLSEIFDKFDLTTSQKKEAGNIFNIEKTTYLGYEKFLYNLKDLDEDGLNLVIICMFEMATSDGDIHSLQNEMILKAVSILGISQNTYKSIEKDYVEDLDEYYKVLGCNKTSSKEEIKRNYRNLMLKYHPDKYVSKDLPKEVLDMINEKCKDVQEAYDVIMKNSN